MDRFTVAVPLRVETYDPARGPIVVTFKVGDVTPKDAVEAAALEVAVATGAAVRKPSAPLEKDSD